MRHKIVLYDHNIAERLEWAYIYYQEDVINYLMSLVKAYKLGIDPEIASLRADIKREYIEKNLTDEQFKENSRKYHALNHPYELPSKKQIAKEKAQEKFYQAHIKPYTNN